MSPAERTAAGPTRTAWNTPLAAPVGRARGALRWGVSYGLTRRGMARAAAAGDAVARLESDRARQLSPHADLDALRARGPVVPGALVWASASHEAVTTILRSDAFVTAGGRDELPGPLGRVYQRLVDPWSASVVDPPSMLAVDGEQHARYRRLVSRAFSAKAVMALEGRIEERCEQLLDRLTDEARQRPGGLTDLVDRYAAQLPVAVIADILGVPESMHDSLLEWGNGAAHMLDPALSWRDYRAAERGMRALHVWFDQHLDDLRRAPGEDLLSSLVTVADAGDRLTPYELRMTGLLVLGAGFETTVNLIGNAVALLDAHPDQRDDLVAGRASWATAVDEVLRYDAPVQNTFRIAARATEVVGVDLPEGAGVILHLAGANRDPQVFEDPHRFDVRRANAGAHLAFSSGAHFCLGAALARREGEVALRALYARFPDLAVAGPGERRPTRVLRGFEHLPVRLGTPAVVPA
ncbi:cytochrome P450 [Nocardioides sp.]|uniref:cytochrome P450 n=1 Tax=Nocardioides sp. TaxID=35761 RepID=UPI003510F9B1